MRYCEACGYVMDEFAYSRDKQNCPFCSGVLSEDNMTALRYAELSEQEKDVYDEQLLNTIQSSPRFNKRLYCTYNSMDNGAFWSGFRPDKWKRLDTSIPIEQIEATIEARKSREPFKPFPPIDDIKAREVAKNAEITRKAIDRGYFNEKPKQSANVPKCPICNSTNLSKISNLKKAGKIGLFGIFGAGDIGKTYKCNNCGSRF